jgi:PAS domain S-box-containing protein
MPDVPTVDLRHAEGRHAAPPAAGWRRLRQAAQRLARPLHGLRMQTALVFGGLTVVVCGAAALALGHMLTTEIHRDTARSLDAVAQTAARTLANGLAQRLREARALAESNTLWADGLDSTAVKEALARAQAARPNAAWIGVADAAGVVRSATSDLLVGQSVAQRPWFGGGRDAAYVGDVHRALLLEKLLPKAPSGEPIRFVDFAAPIVVGGKTIGVLGVHGTWDWARQVVALALPEDAPARGLAVFIFDRAGKLLHSPLAATEDTSALTLDALRPAQPARVFVWPDGQAYLTTTVSLPAQTAAADLGWQIVAREPVARAFERADAAASQALGVALVLAGIASLLAWCAAGVLGRPLATLAAAARAVQHRVPGAAIPLLRVNREVQSLSNALAGMTARLDATYRTAPIGMCQTDTSGFVLSANDRLGSLLGLPVDALRGRRLAELIAERDRAAFAEDLRRLAAGRLEKVARELSLADRERRDLHLAVSASLVPQQDGAAAYLIVVVEDISERIAARAADRANAAKTAFLSQVSHELRTPLNAVLGFSQLMQLDGHDELPARQRMRVDEIAEAGRHLLAMIDDLLDLTQIESDRMSMSLEPVLLSKVVEQSVALVAEAARAAKVTLRIDPPATAPEDCVRADRVRLRQVLVNLLSNAVKYNRSGGTVTVAWNAVEDDRHIELAVTDTGRGIREERMAQLFEPFNRLGAESSGIKGTGIGLVITRKLVEMMDGRIRVASTPDVGSRFSVDLPIADPRAFDVAALGRPSEFGALANPGGRPRTVMYVEDNEVNVLLLGAALRLRPDFQLVVARSGDEALRMAAAEPPDVFLLDMHLGDMTGVELATRLRLLPRAAAVPMVALSAEAAPAAIREAHEAGFADYITKPLDLRKLLASLDAAVALIDAGA